MSESLFNQVWYSIADIKIKLRQHADIHRHIYRGKLVYILQDNVTGQFHRFTPEVYQIIGLMNGERKLQKIWEMACERLGDDMPTQNDIINLVSKLYKTNVIQSDKLPAIEDIDERRREYDKKQLALKFKSPLSIRIPLFDPEHFLARTFPFAAPLIGKLGAVIWSVIVLYGFLQMLVHWDVLTANLSDRVLALENILLIALVYPLVKVVHELGHAYSVKKWGGEVHEIGVMLLVFFPVPYVDATSAAAFRSKYHRMLVGAAGILVEVFLAAAAMILWTYLEQGVLRAVMFNVMLVSGVSTLLFNGNPLLKFDAYYVLSDFLEIPNLATRSNNYIGYLVKRYLFGAKELSSPAVSFSEAGWLAGYSLSAFMYRMFITIAIILFMTSKYFILGTIIGVWFVYMTVISPMFKILAKPVTDPALKKIRSRVFLVTSALTFSLVAFLFVLPLPLSTQVEGVLWVGDQSYLRSEVDGFVTGITRSSGENISSGDVVIEFDNKTLDTKVDVLKYQVQESRERYQASLINKTASEVMREELRFIEQEYERSLELKDKLQLRAKQQGRLVIYDQANLPGRYIGRGQVLGYIVDNNRLPVTVMVSDDDIDLVEHATLDVELRYTSNPDEVFSGTVQRIAPSASHDLVSPVLSIEGGGKIALDPNSKDKDRTFQRYYRVEINVPEAIDSRIEERVFVVFRHKPEPLARRFYRAVRRAFLRHFDV